MVRGLLLMAMVVAQLANAGGTKRLVVQRSTTAMTAVRDCYIWEDSVGNNGNSNTLYTGRVGVGSKNTFLWFDLSGLPEDAIVREARLLLENTGHGGAPIEIHFASRAWMETEPNWTAWSTAFEPRVLNTFTPVLGRNFVDVTIAVEKWFSGEPNNGLVLLQTPGSAAATFNSSEISTQSLRPALEVLYDRKQPLAVSPVPTLGASCNALLTYPLRAHAPNATSWSAASAPEGFAIDPASGELTWRPVSAQRGLHEITAQAETADERLDVPLTIEVRCVEPFRVGCSAAPGGVLGALALMLSRRRR
ncbi:MAG: DNRLRE domain-containing protein [Myxococcaceae bacterium]|nr:DNRLRE domain-containing protein [Myxococcaceae bacterium]